jgi:hypothetical protein
LIEYEVIVNHKRDTPVKPEVVQPGDQSFKEVVFQRNLRANQYTVGQRVKQRGGHLVGTITHIEKDISQINWERNRPMFVAVDFDDGRKVYANPSQLKRTKR